MAIDSQTYEFSIIVIDRVEMLQKEATKQEVAIIVTVKRVLSYGKLADALSLMEIAHWLEVEECLADLKADRTYLLAKLLAIQP